LKAIKFVILAAGVLGLISFFLPLLNVDKEGFKMKISSFDVVKGLELADEFESKVKSDIEALDTAGESKAFIADIDEALDAIKIFLVVLFAWPVLLLLVGGVGALRGKLERVGGTVALVVGLIGTLLCMLILAAWGSQEVKASGGSSGIAVYTMLLANVTGFICGLLTLIKPDRGGRFG
jgi:hypothetical protein